MEIHDDLLISYLLGEVPEEQRIQVEDWLKANPSGQQRLEQFRLVWDTSKKIINDTNVDAYESLQRLRGRSKERSQPASKVLPIKRSYTLLKIAATILLLVGSSWWFWPKEHHSDMISSTAHMKEQSKTLSLSDSSVVTLNRNAVMRYPATFTKKVREVFLEKGEAFFEISHHKRQPFIVHAGKAAIQVLGTSFNVKRRDGSIEVIVETGLVSVTKNGRTVLLKPNEKVTIFETGKSIIKTVNVGRLYQYYRTKEFVADDTPLAEMVVVLNEAYDTNIVIANAKVGNLPLHTTFKNESLDDILDIISHTFGIKVIKTSNAILLK
jgi:transmembrane sensor